MQTEAKGFTVQLYQGCIRSWVGAPDVMGIIVKEARIQVEIKARTGFLTVMAHEENLLRHEANTQKEVERWRRDILTSVMLSEPLDPALPEDRQIAFGFLIS